MLCRKRKLLSTMLVGQDIRPPCLTCRREDLRMQRKTSRSRQKRGSITADALLLRTSCSACLDPSAEWLVTASMRVLPPGNPARCGQSSWQRPDKERSRSICAAQGCRCNGRTDLLNSRSWQVTTVNVSMSLPRDLSLPNPWFCHSTLHHGRIVGSSARLTLHVSPAR